ncbi:hypothetical protein A2955_00680 [Candidatus Woesebacteria bacterium RIFCSPLOWO2_01_FULL_37_19]|uniref:Teneurin-like YD-shell domain-containing protein n=1 Tax=Candidatus Woesebacteria bacterium RIFCSPLOWO2_01_FULL_37_19 TaxID=1802514 RepID=A0A1F8AYN8_9BACT|nr:MAG: hypothetical protein A2955_00680 [Candidatus Woesebacteria bacterium RIFCSPLOWO2_01_FULL_37_19]
MLFIKTGDSETRISDLRSIFLRSLFVFLFDVFVLGIFYFVYGGREVNAAETLNYIHQDHLGSTTLVTDSTGKAVSKQSYYPYGATRSQTSDVGSKKLERQYTGQISDTDQTGLYYYNARYYNPQIAKFTQADNVDTLQNRYAYVRNNPTSLVDPSGNSACVPWDPNCWKEAFTSDFNKVKDFVNRATSLWVNDPEGFTDMVAQTVLTAAPQFAAYFGVMYVAGPQAAEALDVTLCAAMGGGSSCALEAQLSGPNVSTKADDILSTNVVDDGTSEYWREQFVGSLSSVNKDLNIFGEEVILDFGQGLRKNEGGVYRPGVGIRIAHTGNYRDMTEYLQHEYLHALYGRTQIYSHYFMDESAQAQYLINGEKFVFENMKMQPYLTEARKLFNQQKYEWLINQQNQSISPILIWKKYIGRE